MHFNNLLSVQLGAYKRRRGLTSHKASINAYSVCDADCLPTYQDITQIDKEVPQITEILPGQVLPPPSGAFGPSSLSQAPMGGTSAIATWETIGRRVDLHMYKEPRLTSGTHSLIPNFSQKLILEVYEKLGFVVFEVPNVFTLNGVDL